LPGEEEVRLATWIEVKHVIGLLGVLLSAKEKGIIDEVKALMDELIADPGFRVSKESYQDI